MNTVRKKLSILFGILFVLMLTIGGVSSYSLIAIKKMADTTALISLRLERVDRLRTILFEILDINNFYSEGILENQFEFEVLIFELDTYIREIEGVKWTEGEQIKLNRITTNFELLKNKASEVLQKPKPTNGSVATASRIFLLDELNDIRIDLINTSETFFYLVGGKFEDAKHAVEETRDRGINATIIISIFSFFFGGAGVFIFGKRILVDPIKALEKSSTEIGKGNYEIDIDIKSNDEIGVLASAFKTMIAEVNKT